MFREKLSNPWLMHNGVKKYCKSKKSWPIFFVTFYIKWVKPFWTFLGHTECSRSHVQFAYNIEWKHYLPCTVWPRSSDPFYILCVQEVVTSIYIMSYCQIGVTTSWTHGSNLLYKMGHYLLDRRYSMILKRKKEWKQDK